MSDGSSALEGLGWVAAGIALVVLVKGIGPAEGAPAQLPGTGIGPVPPLYTGPAGSTPLSPAPGPGLVNVGTTNTGAPIYAPGTATAGPVVAAVLASGGTPAAAISDPGLSNQQIANLILGAGRTVGTVINILNPTVPVDVLPGTPGGLGTSDITRPLDLDPTTFADDPASVIGSAGDTPDVITATDAIEAGDVDIDALSTPLDIADLGSVMGALGVVALLVDIGFTIAGNAPDAVKAINTALDVGMIVCLYIPVYGWIISIVLAVVKFIFKLFAGQLFGGLNHDEREALERARYGVALSPMLPELAHSYSPRELVATLWRWTSGYCGGHASIAMVVGLRGGEIFGNPAGCPYPARSFEDQSLYFASGGGQDPDLYAEAQVGIREDLKTTFNAAVLSAIRARCRVYEQLWARGVTLDQMDAIAAEYRRTDALNALASTFGWANWQTMFGAILGPYWANYVAAHPTDATLQGFSQSLGFPDAINLRAAAFSGFQTIADRLAALEARIVSLESVWIMSRYALGY